MSSGVQVEVQVEGAGKAAADLVRLGIRAEDVAVVWPILNALFHEDERRRFDEEGPGWAALADTTVQRKQALGQSVKILQASERLKESLTTAATGAGPSALSGGNRLAFGTDVEYARFPHYGTRNQPRRQVVGVSLATRRAMVKVLQEFIARGAP